MPMSAVDESSGVTASGQEAGSLQGTGSLRGALQGSSDLQGGRTLQGTDNPQGAAGSSPGAGIFQGEPLVAIEARVLRILARRGDLLLAAVIIAVIGLLVIPLPTLLLDGLIATNLAASIALLMLSMYVPSALGLSTFPSLLLLTTLFRLSLNIASTKLILMHGAAGHVIDA